jgi:hypothetical protein
VRAPVLPTIIPPPRRRSYGGLSVSVLLHGLLLFLILSPWLRKYHLFSAEGSDLPGMGGGGGRSSEQYIALPALRPEAAPPKVVPVETPVVPPPVVIPTVIPPPTPAPDTVVQPQPQASTSNANGAAGGAAGTGGGAGGGNGGGQGPGTGGGAGPGTGGSERGQPPGLKGFPIPPMEGTPKPLRGKEILVRCYVNVSGKVDRFDTDPPITDAGYRARLADVIAGYRFTPARDSTGRMVAGVALVTLTLPSR